MQPPLQHKKLKITGVVVLFTDQMPFLLTKSIKTLTTIKIITEGRTCNVMPVRASVAADRMFALPLDERACAACWLARTSDCKAFTNARPTICAPATTICAIYLACKTDATYQILLPHTSDIFPTPKKNLKLKSDTNSSPTFELKSSLSSFFPSLPPLPSALFHSPFSSYSSSLFSLCVPFYTYHQ